MRQRDKRQILDLIKTMQEGICYIIDSKSVSISSDSMQILGDVKAGGQFLAEVFWEELGCEEILLKIQVLIKEIEDIQEISNVEVDIEQRMVRISRLLSALFRDIEEIVKGMYTIVFLPYKLSMWDCMESIWEAATQDPLCTCYVVPIAYYDRNPDGTVGEMHYEGDQFPQKLNVLHYSGIDLEKMHPDVIYFHNPYDDINRVTVTDPSFHSKHIFSYTDMYVYVPYYIAGYFNSYEETKGYIIVPGSVAADRTIVQSETLKRIYTANGIPEEKLAVLGSPKTDAVVRCKYAEADRPIGWEGLASCEKVFLLNTSITAFLTEQERVKEIEKMIRTILDTPGAGVIWRPHPLFLATIKSMRPDQAPRLAELVEYVNEHSCAVIDMLEDSSYSIYFSDALISDYSSLEFQYALTEKPVLSTTESQKMKESVLCCDFTENYFVNDGVSVEAFVELVMKDSDYNKEKRMDALRKSLVNADGTCGEKVHQYIMQELAKMG